MDDAQVANTLHACQKQTFFLAFAFSAMDRKSCSGIVLVCREFIVICLRFYGFTLVKFQAVLRTHTHTHAIEMRTQSNIIFLFVMKMNELSRFSFMSCAKI